MTSGRLGIPLRPEADWQVPAVFQSFHTSNAVVSS